MVCDIENQGRSSSQTYLVFLVMGLCTVEVEMVRCALAGGAVNLLTIATGMHNRACTAFHTSNGSLPEPTQRLALRPDACMQEHQQADEDEGHMADTSLALCHHLTSLCHKVCR